MEHNYLLTYTDETSTNYAWFESEDDMNAFVETYKVTVLEAWKINDAEQIR